MQIIQSRRDFLASAVARRALPAFLAAGHRSPTRDRRRRRRSGSPRRSASAPHPQYIAEALLRAEGFTDISYVRTPGGLTVPQMVGSGEIDFASTFAATVVYHLDAGVPVTVLAGLHSGCFELFTHGPIQSIGDLKGRKVGIQSLSSSAHLYMAIMAAQVGLDPHEDLEWIVPPEGKAMELFAARQSRCLSRVPARAAGAARAQDRAHDPQHGHGQAMVGLFLLHGVRQQGLRPRSSGRHQTLPARPSQGDRPLRDRARAGRARSGRCRVHAALRLRAADAHRDSRTTAGASSIPRTRCASSRCACTRSA